MKKRNSFSSSLGFVLAAAGSAVGLGNIWRFPYLAAKDGGGLFLCIYIVLALTFGFTMLITELSIGRKTKQSALSAYGAIDRRFKWIGAGASVVPFMILPYYCVIGGWVMKYLTDFVTGKGSASAQSGYFTEFISSLPSPVIFDIIFLLLTAFVVYRGVNQGIEALSKVMMPILLVMIVGISIYSLTLSNGERTGLEGMKIYIIPDISGMSIKDIFSVIFDAVGQLFYSISVSMGIMVTYGSYLRDDEDLVKSVRRIEFFDTLVAFLAGVMIIPAVYVFMGREGMSSGGPGLMFVALPEVFSAMGTVGSIVGAVFFVMVFFAALTSSISILETITSSLIDSLGWSRKKAVLAETAAAGVLGVLICLGYNLLYFELPLPNGTTAQLLDVFDYLSNYVLMPATAIATCIFIGWFAKPQTVIDEARKNGEKMGREKLYVVMLKFISPLLLGILLVSSFIDAAS